MGMRLRLALLTFATMSLVLLAFLLPLAVLMRNVAEDRAVQSATSQTQYLASVVAAAERQTVQLAVEQVNVTGDIPVTVFLADGSTLGAGGDRDAAVELASRGNSFSSDSEDGRQVLAFARDITGSPTVIRAFIPEDELRRGVDRAWIVLGGLGLLLLAVSIAVSDRLAVSVVRPSKEVAAVSRRLAAGDLDARATPDGPREVRDVAHALNRLGGRIQVLLAEERESIADLSHRLRTPLTALRLDAESLRSPEEAAQIIEHVDAMQRAISQTIAEARTRNTAVSSSDAAQVVADRVQFWSVLAEDTSRTMTLDLAPGPLPVQVPARELAACVDALLGNVFAHTDDGVPFSVSLTPRRGGGVVLTVSDRGPGWSGRADELAHRGSSSSGSTGLGLDIASRTAAISGGRMTLDDAPGGGARVVLELGPGSSGSARK